MTLTSLVLFVSVYVAAVATPGPGIAALIARTLGHIPLVCGSSRYRFEDLPPGGAVTGVDDLAHTMVVLVDDPQAIGKRVGILSGP